MTVKTCDRLEQIALRKGWSVTKDGLVIIPDHHRYAKGDNEINVWFTKGGRVNYANYCRQDSIASIADSVYDSNKHKAKAVEVWLTGRSRNDKETFQSCGDETRDHAQGFLYYLTTANNWKVTWRGENEREYSFGDAKIVIQYTKSANIRTAQYFLNDELKDELGFNVKYKEMSVRSWMNEE